MEAPLHRFNLFRAGSVVCNVILPLFRKNKASGALGTARPTRFLQAGLGALHVVYT